MCLSILGGGLGYAYWCMTDGEWVAQLIRECAVAYFPGSTLEPGRVRVSLYGGELVFRELKMIQKIENAPFEVLRIPWLNVRINTKKLAKGRLEVRDVVVSQPTLRLRRRRDGTWNLDGLLADPWPGPWIETPPITIQNATLELIPDEEPATGGSTPEASDDVADAGRAVDRCFRVLDPSRACRRPPLVPATFALVASAIAARRSFAMSRSRSRGPEEVPNTSSSRARPGETHLKK